MKIWGQLQVQDHIHLDNYMKLYQLLHARERPQSILVTSKRPFENTDTLAETAENPGQIYLRKKGTTEDQVLRSNLAKKETKSLKEIE